MTIQPVHHSVPLTATSQYRATPRLFLDALLEKKKMIRAVVFLVRGKNREDAASAARDAGQPAVRLGTSLA